MSVTRKDVQYRMRDPHINLDCIALIEYVDKVTNNNSAKGVLILVSAAAALCRNKQNLLQLVDWAWDELHETEDDPAST
jgi:hypothetical protein